jgi:F-type H+-transporting ATPase subunit b
MMHFPFPILLLIVAEETHGSGGLPEFLIPNPDLALVTLVIFLALLAILTRYAWRPLIHGLELREKRIADQIDSAQQANDKAQATLRQYEQRLAAAAEQANQVLAQARQEAVGAKDRIIAEANAEALRQRERAVADIEAAKNQALRELAERSVDSAVSLAGTLLGKEIDKKSHSQLIRESIDRFARTGQPN